MAGPWTVALSAAATSAWLPLDDKVNPFSVGFGVRVNNTGDITYTVQHCFGDPGSSGVDFFDHSFASARTTTIDGNYEFPVKGIRLVVTSVSGNVGARLNVLQAGKSG